MCIVTKDKLGNQSTCLTQRKVQKKSKKYQSADKSPVKHNRSSQSIECPVPTISAVNGPAAGAGANLALVADVVLASEAAYFVQAFTRIGLIPDAGGTYFLPRQIGLARAMGAALFADKITARQAADWGMIYEAVAAGEFEAHWRARAAHLAKGPTAAYGHVKTALRASFENGLEEQLALEAKLQGQCGMTHDFKEGVVAFLEKRPARYEGR